ncbi:MAG: chemotaxis protein CheA [Deltaproteobacteria bacterium]|nr:chemotaxis protein CheA [Deltaproteobacteria bacterium]
MAVAEQSAGELLDDMAVKLMMIEPGDLSTVGELLEILEKLRDNPDISRQAVLRQMVSAFQTALRDLIMEKVPGTAESYALLAECVSRMQEVMRSGEDQAVLAAFCRHLHSLGLHLDPAALLAGGQGLSAQKAGERPAFMHDRELLECFIEEAREYLTAIEDDVLGLEKNGDTRETVNAIFRAFHTIKGIADSVSLTEISRLAHATENLLEEARSGRIAMDADLVDLVLSVGDTVKSMVAHVQEVHDKGAAYHPAGIGEQLAFINTLMAEKCGPDRAPVAEPAAEQVGPATIPGRVEDDVAKPQPPGEQAAGPNFLQDSDLLSGFIAEAFEHLESIELNVLELEQNPADPDIINNIFRPFHTIKGVSGFLNLKTINKLAHATENLLDDVRNGGLTMNSGIIDIVLGVGDFLRTMIQNLSDVLEKGPEVYQHYDIAEALERIKACQAGAALPEDKQPVPAVPSAAVAPEQPAAPAEQTIAAAPPLAAGKSNDTAAPAGNVAGKKNIEAAIKVDIDKLDGLVNAVGELVIMQTMVRHNPLIAGLSDPKLNKDFAQLTRITTDLQKTAMSMRMVPIRQTFQKMTRLVRDLAKKTGKKVDLVMEGEDTEIDRNMVDSIYDPLVHMIRNSVDHGVQAPAERLKAGKPEGGTVRLSAYQKGGNIIIEIADDGEGVNTAKIRSKALERGLIQPDVHYSDHDINNLIFLPGFSTADKITDVSGRGVGMDVVKKGVEKLRGKVELQSTPGQGSLFLMHLPLTLAIIDGIVVRVGAERYIIPTIAIRESMRPRMENYNTVQGKGETLLIRDSLLPIIRLYHLFSVQDACTDISQGIAVVVENEGRQRALLVDELLGKQEVVIKSLGGYMKDVKGVAGGTILGDGRVGLILDLAGVISASEEMGTGAL